nr:MAG TPA: hypothetical protein [Caudoviricetes sp.]
MKVKRLGTELDVFYKDGTKQLHWFPEEITRPKYLDWLSRNDPCEYEKIKKVRVSAYRYFSYDIPPEVMMKFKIADLNYSNCGTYRRKKENKNEKN